MKKRTCELWYSKSNNSYTFFPNDIPKIHQQLEKDAQLLFSVQATTWKDACQKYYDYLDWGEYKDSINFDGDWPL